MQVTSSTLLKRAKVLKVAGTVSDKFNSLVVYPGAGTNRKAYGVGLGQKQRPLGNRGDRLTDPRLMGR